ncbi:hypothetical protein DFH07DRAFT_968515 [Mycena maculata]|uniref:Uncharacterized protein n=1 Tax=Mycena maculata TaxID=230809 RepID=A0AAD7MVC9_9AGAR|nr:hypothetical protein DFH07DRAFT_968515 [Mycena maculata]
MQMAPDVAADTQGQGATDTLVNGIDLQQRPRRPTSVAMGKARNPSVTFIPIAPQAFNRYDHGRYMIMLYDPYHASFTGLFLRHHQLQSCTDSYPSEPLVEWIPHEHPEGALYFRHIDKNVFTDVDLYDPAELIRLTVCMEEIRRRPRTEWLLQSGNVDLVLDVLKYDDAHIECAYYFSDHAERLVFWVDEFSMSNLRIWRTIPGITTATHVKLGLEIEYWYNMELHVDYFPSALPISLTALKELRNRITFGIADAMTSPTTIVFTSTDYMFRVISLVDIVAADIESEGATEANTPTRVTVDKAWGVVIGRFMREDALMRFVHFYGETSARLDSMTSVYGFVPEPSYLFIFLSPLLFNSPRTHLTRIHTMYNDEILNCRGWKDFIRNLRSEWQDTILFGTLILNANIGFLAISSGTIALKPPALIPSYISVFFGLGSILTSMFLGRQYQQEDRDVLFSAIATEFFKRRSVVGFQSLAVLYSLPYAFMIWGMLTFLLAFFAMTIQSVTGATRSFVVAIFAVIFVSAVGHLTAEHVVRFARGKTFPWVFARRLCEILRFRAANTP